MSLVADQQAEGRISARRRRLGGTAIGVSVVAHLVVLAIIGMTVPKLTYSERPAQAVNLWLMPRLTLAQRKPVKQTARSSGATVAATPKTARPSTPAASPIPSAPASPANKGLSGGSSPGGVSKTPSEVGVDGGQGVREALRTTVGCDADHVVHLTPAERDRCNQSAGQMAKTAPAFSGLDPLKRGRFDDQAAADERKRASRTGPMQEVMPACPASAPGANLGGACLPDSAIAHLHQP